MPTIPTIVPDSEVDKARWDHTRKRRRMLDEDGWEHDVLDTLSGRMTPGRIMNIGRPITGLNLFHSTIEQIATQYGEHPTVDNDALNDPAVAAVWAIVQEDTHIWDVGASNAPAVIGLRENLVKINRTPRGVRLSMAYPDTIVIETLPNDPDHILKLSEAGIYEIEGKPEACWTVWDITDPEAPTRTIRTMDGNDVSRIADPTYEGWVDFYEDGTPFIPFVRYRAKWSPKQWCAYDWSTLIDATIDTAILWTCWHKWVYDSSWSQRYVIDLALQGLTVTGSGASATASIEADPASILCFTSKPDKAGSASQYQPPGNPKELADAIMTAQASMLSNIGIHPADLEATSQPSSGVAIQLKRSSQRRMSQSYIPQFRAGDTELLAKIAAVHNSIAAPGSPALPEDGWTITYHMPEESIDEVVAELGLDLQMVDAGLRSKVDIYLRMHPGMTREQALQALLDIRAENESLNAPSTISNPQGV